MTQSHDIYAEADKLRAENERLRTALNLICSLEQPIGRSDSNLMAAQSIAEGAIGHQQEPDGSKS